MYQLAVKPRTRQRPGYKFSPSYIQVFFFVCLFVCLVDLILLHGFGLGARLPGLLMSITCSHSHNELETENQHYPRPEYKVKTDSRVKFSVHTYNSI